MSTGSKMDNLKKISGKLWDFECTVDIPLVTQFLTAQN